jgi:hypothetical protein
LIAIVVSSAAFLSVVVVDGVPLLIVNGSQGPVAEV